MQILEPTFPFTKLSVLARIGIAILVQERRQLRKVCGGNDFDQTYFKPELQSSRRRAHLVTPEIFGDLMTYEII